MRFRDYTDGQQRVSIRVEHKVTRADMAYILAKWLCSVETLEDLGDLPQSRIEEEIRSALAMDGWSITEGEISIHQDEEEAWLAWATEQIERCWPHG